MQQSPYDAYYLEFATVLNTALKEDVIITRKDGSRFKLLPLAENKKQGKSPLEDIKGIAANVSMPDILEAIRSGREVREYKTDTYRERRRQVLAEIEAMPPVSDEVKAMDIAQLIREGRERNRMYETRNY